MPRPAWLDNPATERQIEYIRTLATERGLTVDGWLTPGPGRSTLHGELASERIGALFAIRRPGAQPTRPSRPIADEGVYYVRTEDGRETVYVVRANRRTGRRCAYRLIPQPNRRALFSYDRGMVFELTADQRITQAQALRLGVAWGVCVRCGALLTDPQSVSRAIGPVCWERMFGTRRPTLPPEELAAAIGAQPVRRRARSAPHTTCNCCGEDMPATTATTCAECLSDVTAGV